MRKNIYTLILLLVVVSVLVFANCNIKTEPSKKYTAKSLFEAESKSELKKWEATPEGIAYKKWEASPEGKKVINSSAKINQQVNTFTNMEAIVTSLSLPAGAKLGFGVMVKINNDDYILSFGIENFDEFEQLHQLKVNDKIIIRSHYLSYAPKYSFAILAGDYVERDNKIIYKRTLREGGC